MTPALCLNALIFALKFILIGCSYFQLYVHVVYMQSRGLPAGLLLDELPDDNDDSFNPFSDAFIDSQPPKVREHTRITGTYEFALFFFFLP